jgi:hypothetical protein
MICHADAFQSASTVAVFGGKSFRYENKRPTMQGRRQKVIPLQVAAPAMPVPEKEVGAMTQSSATVLFADSNAQSNLHGACKKPSKNLCVGLEYSAMEEPLTAMELQTLSMQLRKAAKASTAWTSDLTALQQFVGEQSSAEGDFPGPCPVVYCGDNVAKALECLSLSSASMSTVAVALSPQQAKEDGISSSLADVAASKMALIWKVQSEQDVNTIVAEGGIIGKHDVFWINSDNTEAIIQAIKEVSPSAAIVASIPAMMLLQEDDENTSDDDKEKEGAVGAEVEPVKQLKQLGCTSIVVRDACVGDGEDLEYSSFIVKTLTTKRSSEFNMTGITGKVNGHFGGFQEKSASSKWRRQKQTKTLK